MVQTTSTDYGMSTGRTAMEVAHSECNAVYTKVDFLRDSLRTTWVGGAEQGYETALVKWLEELRLIVNGMNSMIGTFGGTTRGMANLEDENMVVSSSWNDQLNPNAGTHPLSMTQAHITYVSHVTHVV